MNNLINIKNENGKQLVSARELHEFLEVSTRYNDWIKIRIEKYDFEENEDFITLTENLVYGGKQNVHFISVDMAKELSMVENNEKGSQARKYFIEVEKKFKENIPPLSKEVQAIFAIDARTVQMDGRLTKLENTMTIDYSQQLELRETANRKVVETLGGKDAPAYKECSKKAFSELWKMFKRIMQVNSYRNTSTKEYVKAKSILNTWVPNRDLELMIIGANSQASCKNYNEN